jgi:hypothetical protein
MRYPKSTVKGRSMTLSFLKTRSMLSMIGTWSTANPTVSGLSNTLKMTLPNGIPMEVITLRDVTSINLMFSFSKKDMTGDHLLSLRKIPENSPVGIYETEERVYLAAEISNLELSQAVLEMLIRLPASVQGTTMSMSDGQVVEIADWKRINSEAGEINFRMDLVRAVSVQDTFLTVICEGGINLTLNMAMKSIALAEAKKIRAALPLTIR